MKGVSTIVVVILLLLISIAIVGLAFGFFGRVIGTSTTEGQKSVSTFVGQAQQRATVEGFSGTDVYIRNTGTTAIAASSLTLYAGTTQLTVSGGCPASALPVNSVVTCTASAAVACPASPNNYIRVVSSSGIDDRYTC